LGGRSDELFAQLNEKNEILLYWILLVGENGLDVLIELKGKEADVKV
jgi:hypothetical protein